MTIPQYKAHIAATAKKKGQGTKYSAQNKVSDGITFRSRKEARRYGQLKFAERAGEITELRLQVPFELNPGGAFSYRYVADFVYRDVKTGVSYIEDVKGFRTKEYRRKRKLMKQIYGVIIKET